MKQKVHQLLWLLLAVTLPWAARAQTCATPGKDGAGALTANPNTYYPGAAQASAGATSITVGTVRDSNLPAIAAGDLLLVIQMQSADISATNNTAYGKGTASTPVDGYLNNGNYKAGQYEYVIAGGAVTGTSLPLSSATPLSNTYLYAMAPGAAGNPAAGLRTFQVIRVPQYTNLTLNATIAPPTWNGSTGGITALDVAGNLNFNGYTIDASGRGFRGGAGVKVSYSASTTPATNNAGDTNYYTVANATPSLTLNAMKGEGFAGTPRYVNNYGATAYADTGLDGYPGGGAARGAPGNAGGGGNDNGNNSGGGGGANGAVGGRGGNSSNSNTNPYVIGGEPGAAFAEASSSRLVLGGGGGAGTTNDGSSSTSNSDTGFASSGGQGGGIVVIRVGTVSGTGSVLANGVAAAAVRNDGGGGGGAGGSILLTATTSQSGLANLTLSATGGAGGNTRPVDGPTVSAIAYHGPGGGGGGGVILTTGSTGGMAVTAGANGTSTITTGTSAFGAAAGTTSSGAALSSSISNTISNSSAGANCVADFSTTVTATSFVNTGQSVTVQATFANNGPASGTGTGTVTLPAGATITSAPGGIISTPNGTTTVTYPATTVASGGSNAYTITYTATTTGTLAVNAGVTASNDVVNTANNTASASTTVSAVGAVGTPAACANPGKDGNVTLGANAIPNTYYPSNGAQTLAAGATSISLGQSTGATTPIAAGDLLLVIQMQGATIDYTNTSTYGTVSSTNYTAGTYEYVVARSAVPASGGTLSLVTSLVNGYVNAVATTTSGQRSFQVVRVPQYGSLTLGGNISATPWNGSSGGLVVLDVANQTNLAGYTISATGAGFRGGAGRRLTGVGNSTAYTSTDYRASAGAGGTSLVGADGTKGEGTAGTPRYVNSNGTLLDTQTSYNGLPTTLTDGYPSGDNGRGAPANAGGGGTDADTGGNSQNTGGAGGANGGAGGRGGNSWSSNAAVGGEPGKAFTPASTSRLVLGGGGGAGSTNDGTGGGSSSGIASSGVAGGGIVILRTATINSKGGTIVANGASASTAVQNDGSGGGGAGGSILITASTSANVGYLTLTANGGTGGSNTPGGTATAHGPGGGGGGGVVLTNAAPNSTSSVAAGTNGTTIVTDANNNTTSTAYGSAPGASGLTDTSVSTSIQGSVAGASCPADVTTTITGPGTLNAGQPSGTFTAVFTNNGGSNAGQVTQVVTLPSGASLTTAQLNDLTSRYTGTTYNASTGVISFPTATILAAGSSNIFTFAFTAPTAASTTATIASTVTTAANEGNNAASDNASLPLTVVGVADVATNISASTTPVTAGMTATLTAGFNNTNGNVQATSVVGKVQLPVGLTGVTTSAGTYDPSTGIITYNIGTLNAGQSAPALTITYTQPATGNVTAVSSVSTTAGEAGQVANNVDMTTVTPALTTDVATTISGPTAATAGSQVTFDVVTSNVGTGTNTNVVQTVTLPSGATNVYATGGSVVNTSNGITTVTFPTIAALAAGQKVNNTVSYTAPSASSFATTAGVTSTQDNTSGGNNASSVTTTTSAAGSGLANVYTTVSASAANVATGSSVTFTVTEGNAGANAASGVVSTLSLPTGLPITGTSAVQVNGAGPTSTSGTKATYAGGATYDSATGVLTYNSAGISQAWGSTQSYNVTVPAPTSGVITATAAVASSTPDPMMGNNVASTQVTVDPATTDLATTLTGPDQASVNQRVTFTATTLNNGPAAASGLVQRVAVPAGLSLTGTTAVYLNGAAPTSISGTVATYADGSTYDSGTGLVTLANTTAARTPGGSVSNTITYSVPNNGNASLVNSARVRSATNDSNPANNTAQVVTTIQPAADVEVTLTGPATATPTSSTQGAPVTYGVTTTNNGFSTAGSVTTTVQLPAGLNGVVVTGYDGTVLTNSSTSGYNSSTGVVTFPAVTAQPAGAAYASSGTISLTTPAGAYVLSPTATATLTATSANPAADPNLTNNSATVVTTLGAPTTASVDLSVAIARGSSTAATVAAGSQVVFNVTTSNASTSTASATAGAVTTVQLPAGLTTGGGTVTLTNSGSYDNATGLVTFTTTSDLPAGNSVANTITVSAASGQGPLVAEAAVRGNESDPTPGNNTAATSVAITNVVDVATTIVGPTVAPASGPVSYTVTTQNNGPSTATGVSQTVTLPVGIISYSLNGGAAVVLNNGNATTATTVVTLPVPGTLAAGAANAVDNTVAFTAPASTTSNFPYDVTANISAGNETGSTTNNTAKVTTTRYQAPPVATFVTNTLQAPEGNTAQVAMLLSPLAATSATSTVSGYTLATVPTTAQGTLYYNNGGTYTTALAGQALTPSQAQTLKFLPASGYVGNASFTYTATDANNLVSNVATYLIPVEADNASVSTATTLMRGGSNPYQNGDVLTYVVDTNGAQYTNGSSSAGLVYDPATGVLQQGAANGLVSAVLASKGSGPAGNSDNALPSGVSLDAVTGQLKVDTSKGSLPNSAVAATYSVNVITTDPYGGVNTVTETFTLGANPLPVQLVAFTAQAVQNRDALLKWTTASELHNDHFELERSLDGTTFAKVGQVAGQGNKASTTNYAFTDTGIGAKVSGPVYYRLKQVDQDGAATYSAVQTVSFTGGTATLVTLYPNPAQFATGLDLSALPVGNAYSVTLLDATGRLIRQATLAGGQVQSLTLSDVASGTYQVLVAGQQADGSVLRQVLRLIKE